MIGDEIQELLKARCGTHGIFEYGSRTAQMFKDEVRKSIGVSKTEPIVREALDMIFHKIARIAHGDPEFKDHWDDIAGYASLVSKFLAEKQKNDK